METDPSKSLRIELIIALCALLISTMTAAAALYQGHLIANQLSVTVWPYLSYRTTATDTSVQVDVENVGVGPALIRGASLSIDGKSQPALLLAIRQLGYVKHRGDIVSLSSFGAGDVVRAGETVTIARVQSARFAAHAASMQIRVRIETCYCSILKQCWLIKTGTQDPASIPNCDAYSNQSLTP